MFRVSLSLTASSVDLNPSVTMNLTSARLVALRVTASALVARIANAGASGVADIQVW